MSIIPRRTAANAVSGSQALLVSRLEEVTIHNVALEEKLTVLTQKSISEEDRAAQMDQFLNDEELAMKVSVPTNKDFFFSRLHISKLLFSSLSQRLDVQLQDHQEELFCHKEHLNALRTKEKDSTAQVSNNKAQITRLEKQRRSLESELSAQRSTIEGQVRSDRTVTTPSLADDRIGLLRFPGESAHQPASQAVAAHRRHTDR